jgi:hypothetical protein
VTTAPSTAALVPRLSSLFAPLMALLATMSPPTSPLMLLRGSLIWRSDEHGCCGSSEDRHKERSPLS